jgi:hypothetical protein
MQIGSQQVIEFAALLEHWVCGDASYYTRCFWHAKASEHLEHTVNINGRKPRHCRAAAEAVG